MDDPRKPRRRGPDLGLIPMAVSGAFLVGGGVADLVFASVSSLMMTAFFLVLGSWGAPSMAIAARGRIGWGRAALAAFIGIVALITWFRRFFDLFEPGSIRFATDWILAGCGTVLLILAFEARLRTKAPPGSLTDGA